jgi:hypothetical protein
MERIHALAYLADVLSPVWGLTAFDSVALKTERSPFFDSVQRSLDRLVFEGVVEVTNFRFCRATDDTVLRLQADYALRYESPHLEGILAFIRADEDYHKLARYLEALVIAMSRLRDSEIVAAARFDASWENSDIPANDIIEINDPFGESLKTPTTMTLGVFEDLKHQNLTLTPAAQLRLYASYLGERLRAA